jgi:curved DNA-binding protein CbpA
MSDPYKILGLAPDASEAEIRRRYLDLVRANPPDRAPERFAALHAAYEALSNDAARLAERVFLLEPKHDSFELISADLRDCLRDVRLEVQELLDLADLS